jgi:hypothetical protein
MTKWEGFEKRGAERHNRKDDSEEWNEKQLQRGIKI